MIPVDLRPVALPPLPGLPDAPVSSVPLKLSGLGARSKLPNPLPRGMPE